ADTGMDRETALKISSGFGGGMRCGEVCGAVTGGLMTLGMHSGHWVPGDQAAKNYSNTQANEFIQRFTRMHSTIICRQLLGYDISIESEYRHLRETGAFQKLCPGFIKDAVAILEEMLNLKPASQGQSPSE
ncbi:MAG: C-GCAxxG-C-C family protein, partial [Spirochaeta sp.]